jgi:hypothetical protein
MTECPFKLTFDKITKGIEVDVDDITTKHSQPHSIVLV